MSDFQEEAAVRKWLLEEEAVLGNRRSFFKSTIGEVEAFNQDSNNVLYLHHSDHPN